MSNLFTKSIFGRDLFRSLSSLNESSSLQGDVLDFSGEVSFCELALVTFSTEKSSNSIFFSWSLSSEIYFCDPQHTRFPIMIKLKLFIFNTHSYYAFYYSTWFTL
jgi:hypothetical protein